MGLRDKDDFDILRVKIGYVKDKEVALVQHIVKKNGVITKYGLTDNCEWLLVGEGERYPDICLLPFHDSREANKEWERIRNERWD